VCICDGSWEFLDFDLKKWRPSKKINFLKKDKENSVLAIKGFQIQVTPQHVFAFKKDDVEELEQSGLLQNYMVLERKTWECSPKYYIYI
jgi:hypothetical protein